MGEFAEAMLAMIRELEAEGATLASWFESAVSNRRTGAVLARDVTHKQLALMLRCYTVTEDYLLLLAGQEPRPDGELSELLRAELGEIPQPEKPLAPLPPAPKPERPKPEPLPQLNAVKSDTLEAALAELVAAQDW